MKKTLIIFGLALLMQACSPTMYIVNTNFYALNRGMTKQQFITWKGMNGQGDKKPAVGTFPTSSKTFKHGSDVWEVWVFNVYDCKSYPSLGCVVDHVEHVAFKNGILEEWGTGELPITIRQNPNQFQYDINIQNR
jgi:hypothetical protein